MLDIVIQKKFLALQLTRLIPVATPFAHGQVTATDVIDQFNAAGTGGYSYVGGQITSVWNNWFGGAFPSLTCDSSNNANHDPNSSSMKIAA
jgi:hypothetical protein